MTRVKPKLRGLSHLIAAFVALAAGLLLIARVAPATLTAAVVYVISMVTLFAVSALYHRPTWTPEKRKFLRRLDHAAIYLMIAGSCTPLCVAALSGEAGRKLLLTMWIGAGVGLLKSIFWPNAPKPLSALVYLGLGWLGGPYVPELLRNLGAVGGAYLLLGGVAYTLGAVIYALKRPDPFPTVFGYHEIFHALVIVAAAFHYAAIYRVLVL